MFGPAKSGGNCGFGPQIGKSAERVGGEAAPKVGKQQSPAEDWESGSSSSTDEQLAISQGLIDREHLKLPNTGISQLKSAGHQRLQLHAQLRRILASVDDDLRLVLLSNPAFRRAAEQDPEVDGQ
jgi:hypothetical protein